MQINRKNNGLRKACLAISIVVMSTIVFVLMSRTIFGNAIVAKIKSPAVGSVRILYDTGKGYGEKDFVIKNLDGADSFQDIKFIAPSNIKSFRFDFSNYSGEAELKSVALKSGLVTIKNYPPEEIRNFRTEQIEFGSISDDQKTVLKVTGSEASIESLPISGRRLFAAVILRWLSLLAILTIICGAAYLSLNKKILQYFEKINCIAKSSKFLRKIFLPLLVTLLLFIAVLNRFDINEFFNKTFITNIEGHQSVGVYSTVTECAKADIRILTGDTFKCKDIYFGRFEVPMSPYWKSIFYLSNKLFSIDAYTTFNFMVLINYLLTILAMFFLLRYLKVNYYISVIGAFLAVNNPLFSDSMIAWITLNSYFGLILFMLAVVKFHEKPSIKRMIWLVLANILNFFLCEYYGIFGLVFLASYTIGTIILNLKDISLKSFKMVILAYIPVLLVLCLFYPQTASFYLAKYFHYPIHFNSNAEYVRLITSYLDNPLSIFRSKWPLIQNSFFNKIFLSKKDQYIESIGILVPIFIICLSLCWSYIKNRISIKKIIIFFFPMTMCLLIALRPSNHFSLGNILHRLFPMIRALDRFTIVIELTLIIIFCLLVSSFLCFLLDEFKQKNFFADRFFLAIGIFSIITLSYYCVLENTGGNGFFGTKYQMHERYMNKNNVPEVFQMLHGLPRGVLLELPMITNNLRDYVPGDNIYSARAWQHYQFHLQPIENSFEVENANLAMKVQQILLRPKNAEVEKILNIFHTQFGVDYILVGPNNLGDFSSLSLSNQLKKIYDKNEYKLYEFKTKSEIVTDKDSILAAKISLAKIGFDNIDQYIIDNRITDSRIAESQTGMFIYNNKKVIVHNEKMNEIINLDNADDINNNKIINFLDTRSQYQCYYSYITDLGKTVEIIVLPAFYNSHSMDAVFVREAQ